MPRFHTYITWVLPHKNLASNESTRNPILGRKFAKICCTKQHDWVYLSTKCCTVNPHLSGVGGPRVPLDWLSPRTCSPRTSCPPGRVVLGPNVSCQDRMSPHREVPASLSSDGKLGVGPENKAGRALSCRGRHMAMLCFYWLVSFPNHISRPARKCGLEMRLVSRSM